MASLCPNTASLELDRSPPNMTSCQLFTLDQIYMPSKALGTPRNASFQRDPPWWSIACLPFTASICVLIYDVAVWWRMPRELRPLPFLGNKLNIPKRHPWIQFQKWSKEYGLFYNLWIGRSPTIIILNAKGEAVPDSLTKQLLEVRDADPGSFSLLSERDFSFIPASLFGAGSDTTASILCLEFLAVVTNQDTLEAAHAELDTIIGNDRLPSFDDESLLPYIRAFCKEVLRWRPVAVLGGTPHANTAPDHYQGYYIPTGTNVLGNSWAINLNEEYYPSPNSFNPLRFLDTESSSLTYISKSYLSQRAAAKGKPHPSKLGHSSFGWGRRICPGADLASNTFFIALARLLWTVNISPVKGKEYDKLEYADGFNIRPRSFRCLIRVRSKQHRQVLNGEHQRAEDLMARFPVFREREIQV